MDMDSFVPRSVKEDVEERRKARLIVYATGLGCLAALLMFAALTATQSLARGVTSLAAVIPLLAPYGVLVVTGSTRLAAHLFIVVLAGALLATFGIEGGYGALGIVALPVAATHLLGIAAGITWTLVGALWAAYFGPYLFFVGEHDETLSLTAAAMTVVVGLASLIVESTRARAMQEAAAATADLNGARARMRKVVSSVFPLLVDLQGTRIVYVEPGLREHLGYEAEELLGADLLDFVHPDDAGALERKAPQIGSGQSSEVRLRHKDGHWVWIKLYAIDGDAAEKGQRRTLAGYDATLERDDRERDLRTQRLDGIGVLAAGVAHDFNNLLTVITGFAELMDESPARKNILTAADDAAVLVQKLMAFGKSNPLDATGTDVAVMLRASESVLRSLLAPSVCLHVAVPEQALWVPLASGQINQMVLNLVTNAKEALPDGGNVWIDLETREVGEDVDDLAPGEYAQITVSDDGCGMDPHTLRHAFDPFYTTKADRSGTGLGLASVYGIARHVGGSVALDAGNGTGTAVTLLLPLRRAAVDALVEREPEPFEHGQGTIVVVEDDELIADLIARSLVQAGYSVTIKNDVESAWRYLQEDVPDLLVTDIMMPDGRGTDLARRIHEVAIDLPILFISGYSDQEIGEWKDAAGQVKFLAKPFRAKELLERVGQLMRSRTAA